MTMKVIKPAALVLGAALVAGPGLALAQDAPLEGLIVGAQGGKIVVRGAGGDTPVTLDDSSKITGIGGFMNMDRTPHSPSDLVRGLPVKVKTKDDGQTVVTFKEKDLRTAQQIMAGIVSTEGRVAANEQGIATNASGIATNSDRINNVGELVAAGRTKVYFALGSSALTDQGKQDLQAIAEQAKSIPSYRLVVVGRADPTGSEASNQRLSESRAEAVKEYLLKSVGVRPDRIIPVSALGESEIANDPDPPGADQEARRVTVTIAVSKAVAAR